MIVLMVDKNNNIIKEFLIIKYNIYCIMYYEDKKLFFF